ncbi:MAG TPA: hypothetical protein VK994_05465 [Bacteroidales bacterium]|nr:hypothetical protein [Bacteroidales bacterium]
MGKKKALIVYYTQTGQLKDIVDAVCGPLQDDFDLVYEALKPKPGFPFPWTGMSFYQAFPESVQEIPCELEPFSFDPEDDFELVVLAYQPWYLSPSIPFTAFLQSEAAAKVMRGKPVITILGCRNMWIMAQERVKQRIKNLGGNHVGNIVLVDRHSNLVSVVTIVRWMLKGEKHGEGLYGRLFPRAGVDEDEIREASKYGIEIKKAFSDANLKDLQHQLLKKGAVKIRPVLMSIEKRGFMMFRPWSKFVLRKGSAGDPAREGRLKMFRAYLFTVIYLVSPFGGAVIGIFHTLTPKRTRKMVHRYANV